MPPQAEAVTVFGAAFWSGHGVFEASEQLDSRPFTGQPLAALLNQLGPLVALYKSSCAWIWYTSVPV